MKCSRLGSGAAALATLSVIVCLACATPPNQKLRAPSTGAEVPPEVEYFRGNFKAADGLAIYEQGWRPSEKPRAVVVFLHGLKDHSSRYRELGIQLAHRGIAFYTMDLRGHGYSEGVRDHIDSLDSAVDDVDKLLARVRDRQPGVPLFLAGQGFGAALAGVWGARHPLPPPPPADAPPPAKPAAKPLVAGFILAAPWLRGEVKGSERLGTRAAATFAPWTHSVDLNLGDWSSDPSVVAELKSDPLIYDGQPTASTARELLRASDELEASAGALNHPVVVLFGGADKVASVELGKSWQERLAASDKTLTVFDGLAHDLFHEPQRKQVVAGVLGWLNSHAMLPPEPEPAPAVAEAKPEAKPRKGGAKKKSAK